MCSLGMPSWNSGRCTARSIRYDNILKALGLSACLVFSSSNSHVSDRCIRQCVVVSSGMAVYVPKVCGLSSARRGDAFAVSSHYCYRRSEEKPRI